MRVMVVQPKEYPPFTLVFAQFLHKNGICPFASSQTPAKTTRFPPKSPFSVAKTCRNLLKINGLYLLHTAATLAIR